MRKIFSALMFVLLASTVQLGPDPYTLDKAHTQIGFTVSHLVISNVHGNFRSFNGTVAYDPNDATKSAIDVHIDSASVTTGDDKRDGHLRSPDFFDVEKFPELTFKSTRIEKKDNGYAAYGPLTIHGVTKEVAIPFTIAGTVKDLGGKTRLVAQGGVTVNRKDYGLVWNKTLESGGMLVGDDVKIELMVEAVK